MSPAIFAVTLGLIFTVASGLLAICSCIALFITLCGWLSKR